jgi:O-acetyl-ADP-ribose deacetylase
MPDPVSEKLINGVKLSLLQGDITLQDTDAIVNAANPSLTGGGGVDGAIHRAGGPAILEECHKIVARQGTLQTGKVALTNGGNLKARFVIHAVGPVWRCGKKNEPRLLARAYRESLSLANAKNLKSISFPSISTGAYGYPSDLAAGIALKTVAAFLMQNPGTIKEVIFVLYNQATFDSYKSALNRL